MPFAAARRLALARQIPGKMTKPPSNTRQDTSGNANATASSDTSTRLTSSVARSPLFKLSPELRNNIYRLVLVNDPDADFSDVDFQIIVDDVTGIEEPALLLSNKVVRSEASGMFYYENEFLCRIRNFDPAPILLLQSKFTMPFRDHPRKIEIVRDDYSGNWKNLVSWLHMCHRGKCGGLTVQEDLCLEFRCEARLLDALFKVAVGCPETSWSTLQKLIEPLRYALGELDEAWMQ
jgi:hypothetical protein